MQENEELTQNIDFLKGELEELKKNLGY